MLRKKKEEEKERLRIASFGEDYHKEAEKRHKKSLKELKKQDKERNIKTSSNKSSSRKSSATMTGKERAQALARKRIGKGTAKKPDKTIAQVRADNEKAMRDRARERNRKFKEERKKKKNKDTLKKNTSKRKSRYSGGFKSMSDRRK